MELIGSTCSSLQVQERVVEHPEIHVQEAVCRSSRAEVGEVRETSNGGNSGNSNHGQIEMESIEMESIEMESHLRSVIQALESNRDRTCCNRIGFVKLPSGQSAAAGAPVAEILRSGWYFVVLPKKHLDLQWFPARVSRPRDEQRHLTDRLADFHR